MASGRALLRQLWAMVQTRAEAAGLVVQLQRTAVTQGLLFAGIAAVTALSFMTAVIVWIAVAAPEAWRGWALGIVALALFAAAAGSAITASRRIRRDQNLIADFTRGLKLDLAMVNLALKDIDSEDEDKVAARERAKSAVREAAAGKAAAPSTAEGGGAPSPEGPAMESAAAAWRAAAPQPDVVAGTGTIRTMSGGTTRAPTPGVGANPGATVTGAATSEPHEPAAWGVGLSREREMPDPLLSPDESLHQTAEPSTGERRQLHGST